jgi:hypothetical protein
MVFLAIPFAFVASADNPASRTNSPAARPSTSLPSKIITTDGTVYQAVKLLKIEPDGLLVEYHPGVGGLGLTTLKFAKLPEPLQKQFGYNPDKAAAFEQAQAQANATLSRQMRQAEKTRIAVLNDMSERPNLTGAVSVNSSDPTVTYAYYPPGGKPDEVGEYTAVTLPHFTCHADFTFHAQPGAPGQPVRLLVDTVTISLGLSCHIIEPEHPYEFVSRHEEGHRKICEYFYRFGPQVANRIGDSLIGREFPSSATDVEAAKAQILPKAESVVEGEYSACLYRPCREANRCYDQLNDPEGVHLDVDQAVQQAIAKYKDQINLQPQIPAGSPGFPPIPPLPN